MSESPQPGSPQEDVILGLGGAWGFAPADRTSPQRAAEAGAFTDSTAAISEPGFTELRVHGVSGSDGPTMLEHPHALQVAGDSTTMFYRRWTPAAAGGAGVPWKLEAYSWGGLTEAPLASAAWLLLAPFMFYNVAHFALPPPDSYAIQPDAQVLSRDGRHRWAQGVLRILAFSATLQFTSAFVSILVAVLALQARAAHFPSWLSWYQHWSAADRVTLAMVGVAVVIALMWQISERTAHRYEARTSQGRPAVNRKWPLTQPQFWNGQQLVRRHRNLHAAGAAAATAFIVSRPGPDMGAGRTALMWLSGLVVAAAVVSLCFPLADRHDVTLAATPAPPGESDRSRSDRTPGTLWCRGVLAAGAAVFVGAFFTGGWPAAPGARDGLPGFTNICALLLAAQAVLLILLGVLVWIMAASAPDQSPQPRPFIDGHLTTVLAVLAVGLGGVLGGVLNLFAARLLGTPVPSGLLFHPVPAHALQIPWPIYAFAAAPIGLVAGILIAAVWVAGRWWENTRSFAKWMPGGSDVARFYGIGSGTGDDAAGAAAAADHGAAAPGAAEPARYRHRLRAIAGAWAVGLLVDDAVLVALLAAAGMVVATAWAEIYAASAPRQTVLSPTLHGLVVAESLVGLLVAGWLVALLRSDYTSRTRRKTIGALWDVATFWPRAAHPFAPPCYAERAVPELVDRIRILTGTVPPSPEDPAWEQIRAHQRDAPQAPGLRIPAGPVLLTGYSQGSILVPAVVAQLPDPTRAQVALLTLACPASRLYGRAFPAYFGKHSMLALAGLLKVSVPSESATGHKWAGSFTGGRWKNLVRPTDYIGSWIFAKPVPDYSGRPDPTRVGPEVDQPCWDPVSVAADIDPTPPPIHRHLAFWPDPRVTQLGSELGARAFPRPVPPSTPNPAGPPVSLDPLDPIGP
jgi:hypothetical protein